MDVSGAIERYQPLVDDWERFLAISRSPLPTCIWVNSTRATVDEVTEFMAAEGIVFERLAWHPEAFRLAEGADAGSRLSYLAGLYHVQEEVSLLPVVALAPRSGDCLLDLCAAPGSKTVHAAAAVGRAGLIVSNDRSGARLNVLRTALHRLGLMNVVTTVCDAAVFPDSARAFDGVIADVPCSCEGTSRKHPAVLSQASVARSRSLAERQRTILSRAIDLCRPGGRVVYATCTYAPEENEQVVGAVLAARDDIRILPFSLPGLLHSTGVTSWKGQDLHPDLVGTMRIWPHQNDTGGFFVALLEKTK